MTDNISISIQRKTKKTSSECRICGSIALYSHYGVISCQPCKIFFRRNAGNDQKKFRCLFNNQCQINVNTRHLCASCRLSKCFQQGMKIDMIRRSFTNKKIHSTSNQIQKFSTLNLLEKDNSLLDENQWILLNNLIHNYDHSNLLLICSKIQNQINTLKIINESLVQYLIKSFYEITGRTLRSNNDVNHLPSNDRSILLSTAADNIVYLGGIFIFYYSQLMNNDILWNYLANIYGKLTMSFHRWTGQFIETDIILFKLLIALFTFSSNGRIFHTNIQMEYENFYQIFQIQNQYAELTWKYLIYKYGYHQAIHKFIRLIQWLLTICVFMSYTHHIQPHANDIQSLIEQTELTFILDDVERIV